jgi:hypothetical protein
MARVDEPFDCKNCGATVIVEFGAYTGGPLAYDYYAKCSTCCEEYNDSAEIERLVSAKRALNRRSAANSQS